MAGETSKQCPIHKKVWFKNVCPYCVVEQPLAGTLINDLENLVDKVLDKSSNQG